MRAATPNSQLPSPVGWIYFDGECRFCASHRQRWGKIFERRGLVWIPLQTPGTAERLGVTDAQLRTEMWLRLADGRKFSGVKAWSVQLRHVWWLWPLGVWLTLPGIHALARAAYGWVAAHRHCLGGACGIPRSRHNDPANPPRRRVTAAQTTWATYHRWLWLALAMAAGAALVAAWQRPAWMFMWVMALTIYGGFKCLTYSSAPAEARAASGLTRFLYLVCWPGMSLSEFALAPAASRARRSVGSWIAAAIKTAAGACLVWGVVPMIPSDANLVRGWTGMVGIILMLHFGTFHLLALALQACGFNARPNMQAPLLARSLADFWGRRWNTAFNVLADRYGFRLLAPRLGPRAALAIVFLASGLLHEAVITLPARGAYGLPTAYFALQAVGIFLERWSPIRRRPGLNRIFAWVALVIPLGWLFPPVFVRNIILPMLHAIGAT